MLFKLIQYLSRLILLTAYECALVGNHLQSSIPSALIREQAHFRSLPAAPANAIATSSFAPSIRACTIEILRTIFPSIIPMFIAIPSFALLYSMDEVVVDPAITIKAIGHQWYRSAPLHEGD